MSYVKHLVINAAVVGALAYGYFRVTTGVSPTIASCATIGAIGAAGSYVADQVHAYSYV